MIAVRMMQMALDKIVGVLAMRHGWMAAVRAVNVPGLVALVPVRRRALVRVSGADLDHVLIDAVPARAVQVPVMEIVDMVSVLDGDVSAARSMMVRMFLSAQVVVGGHQSFLSFCWWKISVSLARVRERVVHEVEYVRVSDGVEGCLSCPTPFDQPSRQQHLQPR